LSMKWDKYGIHMTLLCTTFPTFIGRLILVALPL
jgi:hypothetical protein